MRDKRLALIGAGNMGGALLRGIRAADLVPSSQITVVDLDKMEVLDSITTLKDAGYAINHILMLPQWHRAPGEGR